MDTNMLKMVFKKSKETYDLDTMCNCIIRCFQIIQDELEGDETRADENIEYIMLNIDTLIYNSMRAINKKDEKSAYFYFYSNLKYSDKPLREHLFVKYLIGRVEYFNGNYELANQYFEIYERLRQEHWNDKDEISLFYHANALAMQNQFKEAAKIYEEIFTIKNDFPEAEKNLRTIHRGKNKNLVHELWSFWNKFDCWKVPIFINARDRVEVMKKQIEWLLEAGYKNLIILDNDSTYPKLLEYYGELDKDKRIKIIRLEKNLGFKALWKSNILEKLKISTPYVYTDPDVVPVENCPKDFVKYLWKILDGNHELRKVGPGLVYNDITCFNNEGIKNTIGRFQLTNEVEKNIHFAPVDTTFALYSNVRHYNLRFSVRAFGEEKNIMLRHLPWYFDYNNLPEDEQYYMEHAEGDSASLVNNFKNLQTKNTEE